MGLYQKCMKYTLLFLCCLFSLQLFAQKKNENYKLHIYEASSAIRVDGILDEQAWLDAEVAKDFYMVSPMDTSFANAHTEIRMTYDQKNLYILAICYKPHLGPQMVESLRRDFAFGKNDNFIFFLDPFNDQTNGFSFGTNAAGAQWDGLMYDGGKVDLSWDNKWVSEVKDYDDKYVFEAAIPFTTMRYKDDILEWGINFSRNDLRETERSSWAPVPRRFPTASLAYTGTLVWDKAPPSPGLNVSLIPYALSSFNWDYENSPRKSNRQEVGLDAKLAVSSSLNLDLTLNPDFSQVEVDRQVTNLSRYELFFPETRQFFIENGDQFNNFGYGSLRPFFSRRIGLTSPIIAGARLSGKIDQDWRVGLMNMQTQAEDELGLPSQNFTAVALQRRVFSRSNIGFLFVNKYSLNYQDLSELSKSTHTKYNSNIGLEYNLASSNNAWTGKAVVLKSFSPDKKGDDIAQAGNLQYTNQKWTINGQYEVVGREYNAEVGYVPRQGYVKLNPQVKYLFFPKGGRILSHGPQLDYVHYLDKSFNSTDNAGLLAYQLNFRNSSVLTGRVQHDFVRLLRPFDPTNSSSAYLDKGSEHQWNTMGLSYNSGPQSFLTYGASFQYGGYYADGEQLGFTADFGYRFQPYVNILFSSSYHELWLPEPWGQRHFWLLGPRIDLTMTNKIFFTGFFQYNEQQKNININTRFQWRFKPASDFFIVYTDNYLPNSFMAKNRALVLKLTYWWNN